VLNHPQEMILASVHSCQPPIASEARTKPHFKTLNFSIDRVCQHRTSGNRYFSMKGVSGTMVIHTQVNNGLSWYDLCETVV